MHMKLKLIFRATYNECNHEFIHAVLCQDEYCECVDQAMGQSLLSLSFSLIIIQPQAVTIEMKDVITGMRGDLVASYSACTVMWMVWPCRCT